MVINCEQTSVIGKLSGCKWAIFDLDSTLIQQETIDEMASMVGKYDQVAAITKAAMEDQNKSFSDLLLSRLNILRGLWNKSDWKRLIASIKYTSGVERLFKTLQEKGIKTGIVSGGFMEMVEHVGEYLGANVVLANRLEYDSKGFVTGRVIGGIVDGEEKLKFMQYHTNGCDVLAVGDGSNDIPIIKAATLGIAFMGKPQLRLVADYCIDVASFDELVELLNKCAL